MAVGLVCDTCDTYNPMGGKACTRCGAGLVLGGAATGTAQRMPALASSATACTTCGTPVPAGYAFCGSCGTPVGKAAPTPAPAPAASAAVPTPAPSPAQSKKAQTLFFGAMQAARAKLVLIKGDGLDGVSFTLAGQDHIAGRDNAALCFDEDPLLSPVHANFFYRNGKLVVRDEDSVNGVYLRIRGSREIASGDSFLVGEQVLRVEAAPAEHDLAPEEDGTYFFASPRRPAHFRLVLLLRGGDTGLCYRADSDVVSLGREGNDINFPDDPFISGRHAQVSYSNGNLILTDLGSKNGTFLRVMEQELNHGDYVFMGQQLLRVEIV